MRSATKGRGFPKQGQRAVAILRRPKNPGAGALHVAVAERLCRVLAERDGGGVIGLLHARFPFEDYQAGAPPRSSTVIRKRCGDGVMHANLKDLRAERRRRVTKSHRREPAVSQKTPFLRRLAAEAGA